MGLRIAQIPAVVNPHFELPFHAAFDRIDLKGHTTGMEEVLSEIIEKEKEADAIVQEARKKAQEIQREADGLVNSIVEEAKEKGSQLYSDKVNAAEKAAKERYEQSIAADSTMKQELLEKKKDLVERLTGAITDSVLSSELGTE
jgi:vacuolar-type H+-ATPase subunit H